MRLLLCCRKLDLITSNLKKHTNARSSIWNCALILATTKWGMKLRIGFIEIVQLLKKRSYLFYIPWNVKKNTMNFEIGIWNQPQPLFGHFYMADFACAMWILIWQHWSWGACEWRWLTQLQPVVKRRKFVFLCYWGAVGQGFSCQALSKRCRSRGNRTKRPSNASLFLS